MAFDVDTTTDQVVEGLDLTGKTIVITGATSGLGKESARALAPTGAHLVLCGRNDEKGHQIGRQTIREEKDQSRGKNCKGDNELIVHRLKTSSLVRYATRIKKAPSACDLLVFMNGSFMSKYWFLGSNQ